MEVQQTLLQVLHLQDQLQDASCLVCHAMTVVPTLKTQMLFKNTHNSKDGIL
jgi:hypothetical protein